MTKGDCDFAPCGAIGSHEIVTRLGPVDLTRPRKSVILSTKMVGGTGHYLNSPAELSSSVLELLRAHRPDF